MDNNRQFFQRYIITALKITIFAFAMLLMCSSANAQTAAEQQCYNSVQGKVAWNRAGNTAWNEANARNLCKGTTNPGTTVSCFKAVIANFDDWGRGIKECSGPAAAPITAKPVASSIVASPDLIPSSTITSSTATSSGPRVSYDSNPYEKDTSKENNWKWTGGNERTIYNPLDGGILLKYTMSSEGDSDGCSAGAPREKKLFQQACFAHDTNYDAPFPLAGFPGYPSGGSTGQEISDYLFYKDLQLINNNARAKNDGFTNWINDSAADLFYTGVVLGGNFRGYSTGKTVSAKGGVVAVMNNGVYIMTLKVTWTGPDGVQRTEQVTKPAGQTAVIPLSIGATSIKAECWAVGGITIFTKNFAGPGMYAYTVGGTTLIPSQETGLKNNVRNNVKAAECDRCIKFSHEAGYVADMMVQYFVNENMGGTTVLMPKIVFTDKITAGISKGVDIPKNLAPNTKITIYIRGYGTLKNDVFSITINPNFTGQKCFKAWGTIFDPSGGACN